MANINEIYTNSSDYLKAKDLQRPDGTFGGFQGTIDSVEVVNFAKEGEKDEFKAVIAVSGYDKSVVLNKTNGLKLASAYGPDTDAWISKPVAITGSMKSFGNDIVPGVDVQVPFDAPVASLIDDQPPF